jgi:hypothetical protein
MATASPLARLQWASGMAVDADPGRRTTDEGGKMAARPRPRPQMRDRGDAATRAQQWSVAAVDFRRGRMVVQATLIKLLAMGFGLLG